MITNKSGMTTNKNGATALTVCPTQQPGQTAKQDHSTPFPHKPKAYWSTCGNSAAHLTPREQRCLDALIAHPEGLKSYRLRELTCCSYAPDVIQRLIPKGYRITCTMVPDGMTVDGKPYSIGVYRLESQGGQI